jgi:hypothetical protein
MAPDTRTSTSPPSAGSLGSWLAALLAPVSEEEFVSKHWQTRYLLCRGPAERFSALLTWPALNRMLAHHWRETYRYRLAKQGRDLDLASYADLEKTPPRIRARDLTEQLRSGATLSFHAADEVYEPLTRLAEAFEAFFRGNTQINVYAGWGTLPGLGVHHDEEEAFILQVDGRKRWRLYGSAAEQLDSPALTSSAVSLDGVEFDEVLRPGDLLYIPRGMFHAAMPMNEPTLHLTVGIKHAGEMDLKPRPSFSLPWSASADGLPRGRNFLIELNGWIDLSVRTDSESAALELRHRDRTFKFPRGMRLIVEQLEHGEPVPLDQLIEAVATRLDEDTVRLFVAMLVKHNIVAVA